MPDFPRYSMQRQMVAKRPTLTGIPSPTKQDATTKVISALKEIAVKWDDALVTSEINAFKADKGVFLADVKSRAMLDPDPKAAGDYYKEIDNYSKNALSNMSARARQEASLELDTDLSLARIQIGSIFQKKTIVEAQKNLVNSLESYRLEALNTANPEDAKKSLLDAYGTINRNVRDGLISPDEGTRLKDKFNEEVRVGFIDQALYSNPKGFKKSLKSFAFKDEKEKSDKIAKANSLITADEAMIKWEKKQIYTMGAYDLSNSLLQRSLTPQAVKSMYRRGQIDFETASIFDEILINKKFEIPENTKLGKPDFFLRLLDRANDDETEALSIMKQAVRAFGKNEIGANQYAYFISEANKRFERMKRGEPWGDKLFKGCIEAIKMWAKFVSPSPASPIAFSADLLSRFIDKTQNGLTPANASREVIEEKQVEMNPNREIYKIGDIVDNPKTGKSYKVIGFDADGEPLVDEIE